MFNKIATVSDEIGSTQDIRNRGFKFFEEAGEFSVEVGIVLGVTNKTPGPDGVVGEAADVVITCLDIVHRLYPNLTEEEFEAVLQTKLDKWKRVQAKAKSDREASGIKPALLYVN